jgi:hypothetical protein
MQLLISKCSQAKGKWTNQFKIKELLGSVNTYNFFSATLLSLLSSPHSLLDEQAPEFILWIWIM